MKNIGRILLVILVTAGIILRLKGIMLGEFAFTYDTGRDLLAVRDLVIGHQFSLIGPTTGQNGIFYGPWWYWILTIPFWLAKGSPELIAAFITMIGVLSIPLGYFWREKKGDRAGAIFLAAALSLHPYFLAVTTQIWSPDLLVTATLIAVILIDNLPKLSKFKLFILGLLLILLSEFEIVYGLIFILALIIAEFVWDRKEILKKKTFWILGGMIFVELPKIIFEFRHKFLQTTVLAKVFRSQSLTVNFGERFALIWDKLSIMLPTPIFLIQLLTLLIIIMLFIYCWKKVIRQDQRLLKLLFTILVVFFLFTLGYKKEFWDYYLYGIPVITIIIFSILASNLTKIIHGKIAYAVILIYVLLIINPLKIFNNWRSAGFVGNAAVYRNQVEAINYIELQAIDDFNYIAYTPPQIDYSWQYLFWRLNSQNPKYKQTTIHKSQMFVIIEPDPGYERRITDWLKLRENDGIIVKTQEFPSGIIVQTRNREVK